MNAPAARGTGEAAVVGQRATLSDYCASIGAEPLLVQGAGGNASWKDGDTLWVKASGTWLAEARQRDIFVPVDLAHLRGAITSGQLDVTPRPLGDSGLRPSIETLLHALLPQPVVLHLHAVELLAQLVRPGFAERLRGLLASQTETLPAWLALGYHKPGLPLARAVADGLRRQPDTQIVFLQNHGVVIGAADAEAVDAILRRLLRLCATPPRRVEPQVQAQVQAQVQVQAGPPITPPSAADGAPMQAVADAGVQQLALDPQLYRRLARDWAICPDHVVFLGATPRCHDSVADFLATQAACRHAPWPELLFIGAAGVYTAVDFSAAKLAQLRCYYDVLARQDQHTPLTVLDQAQLAELLDWDAEKYRLALSR
ncbi:class II aldolase/adducin family protein [Rugamonas sp. CCM 8940]|uniref:class II aldolase/adducin family protein n=1 Tax=Rugamonas sp. CCM 8940 TaxID=2765359 RepID=UPI0018F45823|nr:class II aldolase/adducin family protein [Rugamonas sp. CCM 8940]MBJ7310441.1 class II aldolase [Rugamonas sp. CCM 8940]